MAIQNDLVAVHLKPVLSEHHTFFFQSASCGAGVYTLCVSLCVCVCVYVRAHAHARGCVCVCMCVFVCASVGAHTCLFWYPLPNMGRLSPLDHDWLFYRIKTMSYLPSFTCTLSCLHCTLFCYYSVAQAYILNMHTRG